MQTDLKCKFQAGVQTFPTELYFEIIFEVFNMKTDWGVDIPAE